jgi:Flp pilus assembly protein TadD/peroxiredoxin
LKDQHFERCRQLSRRDFLNHVRWTPTLIFPFSLRASAFAIPSIPPAPRGLLPDEAGCPVAPDFRAPNPLAHILSEVKPGQDAFITEVYAAEIHSILARWEAALRSPRPKPDLLIQDLEASVEVFWPESVTESVLRRDPDLEILVRRFQAIRSTSPEPFSRAWTDDLAAMGRLIVAEFKLSGVELVQQTPLTLETEIMYDLVGQSAEGGREQRVGTWTIRWKAGQNGGWKAERWKAREETRSRVRHPLFVDVTQRALGANPSYALQMLRGTDYWRSQLDAACGIDVYGNNGIAVGDFDGDGHDDFYVCETAGLPNRLYRNRGDGSFEDVSEQAGVAVLDNTACALFADFLNRGRQDLLVVRAGGPLLFLNQGNGKFELRPQAFRFAEAPQGTFTGAAAADYDRDGRLDVYFCVYNYYIGLSQYNYPIPYYDAQNGPPNFLFHNEGDSTFTDRTAPTRLNQNNNRYSFACAWGDYDGDGWPDLYVANDFGRKNLYHNNGDGTFTDVAASAGVEDYGAGMSACWLDYDNDGRTDLYVGDMWTAAGLRVTEQSSFQPEATPPVRAVLHQHASGNALFHNGGEGKFTDATALARVAMGRWAWGCDAWDFDNDGFPDLYIANGFISGPNRQELSSFFWRQVVGHSPLEAKPAPGYEQGWNAINELIRSDGTWAGYQRNVFYANDRRGAFADISGVAGLDFLQDSRSFALADFDHDGRIEVVLKNRNAPRLRILRNAMKFAGDGIAISLRGDQSNRDAIGATVTIETEHGRQAKTLQAGSGFLMQHSKDIFFGLGKAPKTVRATVRWPSGHVQKFDRLPANSRIAIEEGQESFRAVPFAPSPPPPGAQTDGARPEDSSNHNQTWLIEPLPAPAFALPDLHGQVRTLESFRGSPVLLSFWSVQCPLSREQVRRFQESAARLLRERLALLAVAVPGGSEPVEIRNFVRVRRLTFPVMIGDADVIAVYDLIYRYLFDRHRDLLTPTSFLLDESGWIIRLYRGLVHPAQVIGDWRSAPHTAAERVRRALPFAGSYYGGPFQRNQFTYGVAFFERGYAEQAIASFKQTIAANPANSDAYYNLGTLYLRKGMLAQAREALETTVHLKPVYPNAWNNLGMIAAEQGRSDEAIQNFRRAVQQDPADAVALQNLGSLLRRLGKQDQAEAALRQAVKVAPNDPEANYTLGMFYAEQNDSTRARRYLEKALELQPDFPSALNNLGVVLLRSGHPSEAEQSFQKCIRVAPDFDQAPLNLARLYSVLGRRNDARRVLKDFLERHPSNAMVKAALQRLSQQAR